MTGRAVRVNSQLKSHKRFANAFPRYCKLVDNARLYCTNSIGGPPKVNMNYSPILLLILHFTGVEMSRGQFACHTKQLIGWKDGDHSLLVDPEDIKCLKMIGSLNAEADSIYELHMEPSPIMEPGSVWNDFVLSSSRSSVQEELRESILKIEKSIRKM